MPQENIYDKMEASYHEKESIMNKQRVLDLIGGLMVLFAILPLMLNAGTLALLALGLLLLSV